MYFVFTRDYSLTVLFIDHYCLAVLDHWWIIVMIILMICNMKIFMILVGSARSLENRLTFETLQEFLDIFSNESNENARVAQNIKTRIQYGKYCYVHINDMKYCHVNNNNRSIETRVQHGKYCYVNIHDVKY